MHILELSRLKGAPSTCSVGHRKGKAMERSLTTVVAKQGLKILGCPVGHPDFVQD